MVFALSLAIKNTFFTILSKKEFFFFFLRLTYFEFILISKCLKYKKSEVSLASYEYVPNSPRLEVVHVSQRCCYEEKDWSSSRALARKKTLVSVTLDLSLLTIATCLRYM